MVFKADTLTSSKHDVIADDQLHILKKVISDGWPDRKADAPLEVLPFWTLETNCQHKMGLSTMENVL